MNKAEVQSIRDKILSAVFAHVTFDGWTWNAIEKGAVDAGFDEQTARAVFPDLLMSALDHFSDMADREMLHKISSTDPENLRVRERIREAVIARYEFLQIYKEAFRNSLSFWSLPTRKPRAAKIVWRTADKIWQWAGDSTTDYNRYTKRALLSGILLSTSLVFLNDTEEGLDNTKAFLDRRIENVMQLGSVIGKFSRKV